MDRAGLVEMLSSAVGRENVAASVADRVAYSADMWPRAQIWKLQDEPARHAPDAVVTVGDREALCRVLVACREARVPVIPYGAGSGVCGGALPVRGGVVIDVKRMNRIVHLDERNRLVTVEAGRIGQQLEDAVAERGFTLGHFPSSVYCSTVGGYAAARSAGQYSSKYGVFEDLIHSMTVALPDGRLVATPPPLSGRGGLDWQRLFVGSEGTLGVVVDVTLRLRVRAEANAFRGARFPDVESGLAAMRTILQSGLRPCVLRLYDPFDTFIAGSEPDEDDDGAAPGARREQRLLARLAPLRHDLERGALQLLLARPGPLNRLADRLPTGCRLIAGFEGPRAAVDRASRRAWALLAECGGRDEGPGPGLRWHQNRHAVSFKQSKVFMAGAFVDTMEVSTTWDRVAALYGEVRRAVGPLAFIMAHFSHAYREGCSIYFTFAGRARDARQAARLHEEIWDVGLRAVARGGGSVSHHHGIGLSKRDLLPTEHGAGGAHAFAALKAALDPAGVLNPGKLWRPPTGDAAKVWRREPVPVAPVNRDALTVRVSGGTPWRALETELARQGFRLPLWPTAGPDGFTVDTGLAEPARLDWGPEMGDLAENVLSVAGVLPGETAIEQVPAARRATGPEMSGFFFGQPDAALAHVTLRVLPRTPAPQRLDACADDGPDAALAALRTLYDHELRPLRVALQVNETGARLSLLVQAHGVGESRALLTAAGLTVDDGPPPWPTLPVAPDRGPDDESGANGRNGLERVRLGDIGAEPGLYFRFSEHECWRAAVARGDEAPEDGGDPLEDVAAAVRSALERGAA